MENATGLSNHLINSKGKVDRKLKLTIKNIKKKNQKGTKSKFSLFFMDYWSLRRDRYRRCSLC